jgi:hypothetical protein
MPAANRSLQGVLNQIVRSSLLFSEAPKVVPELRHFIPLGWRHPRAANKVPMLFRSG